MRALIQHRFWRPLFLAIEAYALIGFVLLRIGEYVFGRSLYRTQSFPLEVAFGLYALAALYLMVVSPLFIPSLKRVALIGWCIGFGIVLIAMITPLT